MSVRSSSSYAYMMVALRRNRKIDGDALEPDVFTQIAWLDLAGVLDFDRGDIGADRADVIGDGLGEQRAGVIGGAHDRRIGQVRGPIVLRGAIDHDTIPGAVRRHHGGSGDPDFLLFERRGHSAALALWAVRNVMRSASWRKVSGTSNCAAAPRPAVIPGTTEYATPACRSTSTSSPPRPNTNASPPLSRTARCPDLAASIINRLIASWPMPGLPTRRPTGTREASRRTRSRTSGETSSS